MFFPAHFFICCTFFLAAVSVLFFFLFIRADQKEKIDTACINVLFAQAGKAIFYFDTEKGKILPTKSFEIVFGQKISAMLNIYDDFSRIVFQEDESSFKNTVQTIRNGSNVTDYRFRITEDGKRTVWCTLTTTIIKGRLHKPIVIGALGNIDREVREEEQLRFKAERDSLTGLYNRITTEMLVSSILLDRKYKNTQNALLIIDIDNLKCVNDTLGHQAGDKVITRIADCIRTTFRESDITGRIGGDEFAVFLKDITKKENAYTKAQKMCGLYQTVIQHNGCSVPVSCSIGIAVYPEHGTTFAALFACADNALYIVKDSGKNHCLLFVPDQIPQN
jgi:diguanylate cyclase (GGDEF) domain